MRIQDIITAETIQKLQENASRLPMYGPEVEQDEGYEMTEEEVKYWRIVFSR